MSTTNGIFLLDNKNKILLVHATNGRWNQWSIPKGMAEESENSLESAIRELMEETNIDLMNLTFKYSYKYNFLGVLKYKSGKKILSGHIFEINSNLSEQNLDLKCESMILGTKTPECDKIVWYDTKIALDMMHEAQSKLLKYYLKR